MGRILKLLGAVVGVILLLVIIGIVGITMFFDPNDYRDEISVAVEQSTGRQLNLEGDLELEIFPRLRIALGAAEVSNATGFGDQPFASIEGAGLAVGLLPLLSRRIEIDEARLDGLVLNLARDAQGRNNWQDIGGEPAPDAAPADEVTGDAALDLNVAAIVIANAEVNWNDAAAGSNWQLANFNLDAENLSANTAFPLELGFSLSGDEIDVAVDASMDASLGLADNRYLLENLSVEIEGSGPAWPGGDGDVALRFDAFDADLGAETLDLRNLTLEALGLTITGSLAGQRVFSNLSLAGAVAFETFDPQDLLEALSTEVETADSSVLRSAAINANLAYDANRMMLEDMTISLDESQLSGDVGFVGDTLSFNLAIDSINLDRYLPPASEGEVEEEGSLDEVDLPLDVLRTLSADGQISIGEAQFSGLSLSDVRFSLAADDGVAALEPSASLYGGSFDGAFTVEVADASANLSVEQQLVGIDAAPLGRDLLDAELFSGMLDASFDLSASGSNLGEVRRQLDGDMRFALTDGTWEGVDMWYELRRARAVFDSRAAPERGDRALQTPFSEISLSGVIEDGVMTSPDLTADLQFMTVTGGGVVNLLTDAIDFDLVARFVDGPILQSDPEMVDLAGDELPLTVGGTLAAPSVRPNFGAMIRAEAEEAIQEEIEEEREELRERLEDRLRGIFDR